MFSGGLPPLATGPSESGAALAASSVGLLALGLLAGLVAEVPGDPLQVATGRGVVR